MSHGDLAFSTETSRIEGAFLALEVKTGAALAWLGGRSFKASQLNRVYQAKRPPGSAFKPFVWLAAIQAGAHPGSIYEDLPLAYSYDGRSWRLLPGSTDFFEIAKATRSLAPEAVWVPDNFDGKYLGPITLRRALALSRNMVSVRLVDQVSPAPIIDLAHRAGIASRLEPVLSLGLGTNVVTLLELVSSYQTLANMGVHAKPYAIRRITESATGEVLEENLPELAETLAPAPVYMLADIMRSVVAEGTARSIGARLRRPLAGKTGTTNDNRDLWFLGFTPEVVAGGWMGYDSNDSIGKKDVTGGSTVGPWWAEAMAPILADYPARDFGAPPEGIIFQKVCSLSGKLSRAKVDLVLAGIDVVLGR
jgi:penicillin-binding protein 1A